MGVRLEHEDSDSESQDFLYRRWLRFPGILLKGFPVRIISEGLPLGIRCYAYENSVFWEVPKGLCPGLGSSAAKNLSYVRARYPHAEKGEQIRLAIEMDRLQAGGCQDAIAAAQSGLIHIYFDASYSFSPIVITRT